jgi:hypothetical protein
MLIGIGFLSILTATIASTFISADRAEGPAEGADESEVRATLERIEKRLAAIDERQEKLERSLRRG